MVNQVLKFFLTDKIRYDDHDVRNATLVIGFSYLLVVAAIIYSIVYYAMGHSAGMTAIMVACVVLATVPFIMKFTSSTLLAGNLISGIMFILQNFLSLTEGGVNAVNTPWMLSIPVISIIINGLVSGVIWGILSTLSIIFMYIFSRLGFFVTDMVQLSTENHEIFLMLTISGLVLTITGFCLIFDVIRKKAFEQLKASDEESTKNSNHLQTVLQKLNVNSVKLGETTTNYATMAEQMQSSANEIASGTEQESASLAETASTVQEMVTSIQAVTKQVETIQKIANSSETKAQEGAQSVFRANDSMNKIEESSQKIEGIISVITEIANQTNLLSLNAAIEAAKAGEFGKGFSVVAEEVRNLAERSQNSVIEIRSLIEVSSQNVKNGSSVIQGAEKILYEIVEQTKTISSEIDGVTSDIQEHDQSIQEVSKATEYIAGISDNNATASSELSISIDQLASTTQNLQVMVDDLEQTTNLA